MVMGPEDVLNLAFATKLTESPEFSSWVLSRTKFAEYAACGRLLDKEQALARQAKFWWRHCGATYPTWGRSRKRIFLPPLRLPTLSSVLLSTLRTSLPYPHSCQIKQRLIQFEHGIC